MRRFVGFGFGPIQAGLMLYEAQASRAFDDYAIAEVDGRLVDAVRAAGGAVTLNVAAADGRPGCVVRPEELVRRVDEVDANHRGRSGDQPASAPPPAVASA
jgi:hypothetical protein